MTIDIAASRFIARLYFGAYCVRQRAGHEWRANVIAVWRTGPANAIIVDAYCSASSMLNILAGSDSTPRNITMPGEPL